MTLNCILNLWPKSWSGKSKSISKHSTFGPNDLPLSAHTFLEQLAFGFEKNLPNSVLKCVFYNFIDVLISLLFTNNLTDNKEVAEKALQMRNCLPGRRVYLKLNLTFNGNKILQGVEDELLFHANIAILAILANEVIAILAFTGHASYEYHYNYYY